MLLHDILETWKSVWEFFKHKTAQKSKLTEDNTVALDDKSPFNETINKLHFQRWSSTKRLLISR